MTRYPQLIVEFRANWYSEWIDITKDVVLNSLTYKRGSWDSHPVNGRIADVGDCTFKLKNGSFNEAGIANYYTPGHANCLSGFGAGGQIAVAYYYAGEKRYDFFGRIPRKGVIQDRKSYTPLVATVTVYDWMYIALNAPIRQSELLIDVDLGEVAKALVDMIDVKPEIINYTKYAEVFPTGFDTLRKDGNLISELQKAIESEMGTAYLRIGKGDHLEALVVAGREYPSSISPAMDFPIPIEECDYLVEQNGDLLVDENGDYLAIASYEQATEVTDINDREIVEADQLFSQVTGRCYPRKVGDSSIVLYTLHTVIEIGPGETSKTITLRYSDPVSGSSNISGTSIEDPVSGDDYSANSAEDGSGTDLTSDLSFALTKGLDSSTIAFTNNNLTNTMYIIFFQLKGIPIYINDVLEFTYTADDDLIVQNGVVNLTLDQKYLANPLLTASFVELIGARYSQPVNTYRWFEIDANKSNVHAGMLMRWDIGDRIPLVDEDAGIDDDYIISGISVRFIDNLILRKFFVKALAYDTYQFWQLGIPGYSELGTTATLGFEE